MAHYLYSELAELMQALQYCQKDAAMSQSTHKHRDRIEELVSNYMPSGSGFNYGTKLDIDSSSPEKLVFVTEFHHMDNNGYYRGWTSHTVVVTPSLADGFRLRATGRNLNDIKDHIYKAFSEALVSDVEWEVVRHWKAAKDHGVEIRSEWVKSPDGQDRLRYFVVADGAEVFDSNHDQKDFRFPLERCRAMAVEIVKDFFYSNK